MAPELGVEAGVTWRQHDAPLAWVLVLLGFLFLAAAPTTWGAPVFYVAMIPAIWLTWRKRRGALRATARGITVNGKQFAPWARVAGVVQAGDRPQLLVRYRWFRWTRTIMYNVYDTASALRIQELATSRVGTLEIGAGDFSTFWLVFGGWGVAVAAAASAHVWWIAALMLVAALPWRRPVGVVGADGVLVRGWLRNRFARADRIVGCKIVGKARLRLALEGEKPIDLRLFDARRFCRAGNDVAADYVRQIQSRILAIRRPAPDLSEAQRGLLRRGERPIGEWLRALRDSARSAHRDALPR